MLVVVGDLVEDIVVWRAGALQENTDNPAVITRTGGGSAANTAASVAVDTPVRFIGRIGDDAVGRNLAAALAASGVDVKVQVEGRSGSIVILVDRSGERTMFPDRGAAAELNAIDASWFDGMTWLHLTFYGFATEPSEKALLEAIRIARKMGAPISIDLSSVSVMNTLGKTKILALLEAIRPAVIFANMEEAQAISLRELPHPLGTVLVIKQGADHVLLIRSGKTEFVPTVRTPNVKDTTGAGDAFSAGYIRAALAGGAPLQCAQAGVKAAAEVLSHAGGRVLL